MPTEETVSYWTVCWLWGFIPYPCKKYRTEWCYTFKKLEEYRYVFFCYLTGCEAGIKYCWYDFCFLLVGKRTYTNIRKCYKNQRPSCGEC